MEVEEFISQVNELNKKVEDVILPHYNKIIAYENNDVIEKFRTNFDVSESEAKDIFKETLKFLYLAHVGHSKGEDAIISDSTKIIDHMWHTFILFTRDYGNFCQKNFGRYLHHQPFTKSYSRSRKALFDNNPEKYRLDVENKLSIQLANVAKYLGADTLTKWYVEYEDKYSIDKINKLQKQEAVINTSELVSVIDGSVTDIQFLISRIIQRDAPRIVTTMSCGCSGKGCGAGCSCNSGTGGSTFD